MLKTGSTSSRRLVSSLMIALGIFGLGAVLLAPAPVDKVLTLWPDQFAPSHGAQWGLQTPTSLGSGAAIGQLGAPFASANFHALAGLRSGRTIKGVTYYHAGFGNNAFTVVSLLRRKLGEPAEVLANGGSTANTQGLPQGGIIPVVLNITSQSLTVDPAYRYFVTVNVDNSDAAVFGVQITCE
jgi:hypothetical protein